VKKMLPIRHRKKICSDLIRKNLVSDIGIIDVGSFNRKSILSPDLQKVVSLHTFDINVNAEEYRYYNSHIHYDSLASDKRGESDFYLTRKRECSSLFKPNAKVVSHFRHAERFDVQKTVRVKTDTLDNLIVGSRDSIDFLKLDAQGSEFNILKGSKSILKSISLVQCEVSLLEIYESSPSYYVIAEFMDQNGFMPVDASLVAWNSFELGNSSYYDGITAFGDILFVKKEFLFDELKLRGNVRKRCHLVFLLVMFGYPLVALNVVKMMRTLAPNTVAALEIMIKSNIPNMALHPFGRKVKFDFPDL
jgi:FkbM family methyltransferase